MVGARWVDLGWRWLLHPGLHRATAARGGAVLALAALLTLPRRPSCPRALEQELVLLEKEAELLEKEQTLMVLREEVRLPGRVGRPCRRVPPRRWRRWWFCAPLPAS